MIPAIFAPEGLALTDEERAFFREVDPYGFILFARNVDTPDQVRGLVEELKSCASMDPCPVLIDQEGGRVARLRPPHWPEYPAGEVFGKLAEDDLEQAERAAWLNSRLIAADLSDLGLNVDCLPVLDVPVPGSHDVIGNRAYSRDPEIVGKLGRAAAEGLMAGGVLPVIKHIPGHGRGGVDSHHELPKVETSPEELAETDFAPFHELAYLPFAMTGHVLYTSIDPDHPASTSKTVIGDVIRNQIGFKGVLMSDDLNMEALGGTLGSRAAAVIAAGCDIALHCSGKLGEMKEVAKNLSEVYQARRVHLAAAMEALEGPDKADIAEVRKERDELLKDVAA